MSNNKRNKNTKKIILIMVILCSVIAFAYFGTAVFFQSHFLPNTNVNGIECSYKNLTSVNNILEQQSKKYQLEVKDRKGDVVGTITAQEIDFNIDAMDALEKILIEQNVIGWISAFWKEQNYDLSYGVNFDSNKTEVIIMSWDDMDNKKMEAPKDAYISDYSKTAKEYHIIPETEGTLLDADKVKKVVIEAVHNIDSEINLYDAQCYVLASITASDVALGRKLKELNKWVSTCITYDWNGTEVIVDGDTIHEWISKENGILELDEEAIAEFVATHAKENDTYGRKRKFITTLGEEIQLPSGAFGWKTDRAEETKELIKLIQKGSTVSKEPVYTYKGANKGKDDIGLSYVECDLTNQRLYLYENGVLILDSDLVSGKMSKSDCITPPGVFGLTYKTQNAVLRGDDYETPVSFWMPFNGNIGMHDAVWRKSFGGDIYLNSGSHGCINLPYSTASEVYEYVSAGFPVICYYY